MAETPKINVNGTSVVKRPVGDTSGTCFKQIKELAPVFFCLANI